MAIYHEGSRELQDRFDTRRLADRIEERLVRDRIDDDDRAFIEARDMFFIATTDERGQPQCSYKGGEPGFVRVLDERTLAFPVYDGNGMYLTAGNLLVHAQVGLLFIDFEGRKRMRLNGVASVADPCPRYIHEYRLVQRSRFVPKSECETPVPQWKRSEWAHDVLPADDPANDPNRKALPPG